MDKMGKLGVVWGIVLVLIVVLLTTFGFIYKNKTSIYKNLEEKLVEAEKKYVDAKFLYPKDDEFLKTDTEILVKEEYIKNLKIKDEECTGYVEVFKNDTVYDYKAYIKCDNYETKGYEK